MLMLHIYFGINEAFFIVSTSPMKNSLSIEIRCHVTDCGVIEHLPDLGHWGLDSDLLFKGLRN